MPQTRHSPAVWPGHPSQGLPFPDSGSSCRQIGCRFQGPSKNLDPGNYPDRLDLTSFTLASLISKSSYVASLAHSKMLSKLSLAILILILVGVHDFWRMECPHRLGLARVDPLMSPGRPAQHAHAIYGSNGMYFFPQSFLRTRSEFPHLSMPPLTKQDLASLLFSISWRPETVPLVASPKTNRPVGTSNSTSGMTSRTHTKRSAF